MLSLEGLPGFKSEPFINVHEKKEGVTSIRINPAKMPALAEQPALGESKISANTSPLTLPRSPVPWSQSGYYLEQRPSFTFDPFFHAGCYYVQEASSMFLEQALTQQADLSKSLKVLDLCAAPGGKSTHIQSLLSLDSLLVSNEFIRQRTLYLTDNIIKWGCANVFVTNNDPKAFQRLGAYFDVMVVDAPCSGSGLFRKDADAIKEWSLHNVALCSQRQQRILADALPALKENGLLVYSTCSYSVEENEQIMDWLVAEMDMENLALQVDNNWNIVETKTERTAAVGYRFYPDKLQGEGFFLACFRKKVDDRNARLKGSKQELLSAKEKKVLEDWVMTDGMEFFRFRDQIIGMPQHTLQDFMVLQSQLNVYYAGVSVGEIMKERLVPHHALAQNRMISASVPVTNLAYDDAIRYLQRQDLSFVPDKTGWQVAGHQNQQLGWMNALKNRVNNYYPKEIRILKQNNTPFAK